MMKDASVEKASDVYVDPALTVTYSESTGGEQLALDSLRHWIEEQGRLWPASLGATALAGNMQCVHVPCLLAEATVAFGWSAEVAYQRTREKTCWGCWGSGSTTRTETYYEHGQTRSRTSTVTCWSCGGSGRVIETYEERKRESGTVEGCVVTKNENDAHGDLRCGAPDLAKAVKDVRRLTSDSEVFVVAPGEALH